MYYCDVDSCGLCILGCHDFLYTDCKGGLIVAFPCLKKACKLGNEGQSSVEWLSSHKPHILTTFNGHSLKGCLFLHFEQKMLKTAFSSSCFLFVFIVSDYELRVLKISTLKFSKIFPNSILVTPPEVDLLLLASLIHFPLLALLREYFLQIVQIS